jgi:hypothetical protein
MPPTQNANIDSLPGETLSSLTAQVNAAAAQARAAYGGLEASARQAVLGGAAVGGLAGAAVGYYLYRNMGQIRAALNRILDVADTVVRNGTPVISLFDHSFGWLGKVRTPASDIQATMDELINYDFVKWSGPAAEVYKDKRSKQKDAVGEVVAKAESISSWLMKIAKANVDYAVEVLKILTPVIGKLAEAAANAGTLINVLFAIDDVAEVIGKLVEDGLNMLLAVVRRLVESLSDVRDLASAVGDRAKLPGGKWPEAVRG